MFHKEGAKIILISTFIFTVLLLGTPYLTDNPWILKPVQLFLLAFLVIILQFFRNPNRALVPNDQYVYAPVDG